MTPKEKAKELVDKFYNLESEGDYGGWMTSNDAEQCALIAVDEIIDALKFTNDSKWYVEQHQWWQQVKEEIIKL